MMLDAAVDAFLQQLEANGCSVHTVRSYRSDLRSLGRFYGGKRPNVRRITAVHLSEFLTSPCALVGPTGRARSPGALNRLRAVLRSFFRWLHETGQVRSNPACALRVRSLRPAPPAVLDRREERRLLEAMRVSDDVLADRDRVMVEVLSGTGIRISELVGLDLCDVDPRARQLTIRAKGGVPEARYLNRRLVQSLRGYLRRRTRLEPPCDALFVGQSGRRLTARHFARRLRQWLAEARIDRRITPHTFRHSLATRLLGATGNLRLVQRALGHRRIDTTSRYAQLPDEALAKALELA
jgi:integrase/recombinase XerC